MVQTLATEDKTKTIKNTCCQVPHGITGISFESRLLFGRSCRTLETLTKTDAARSALSVVSVLGPHFSTYLMCLGISLAFAAIL
jgi:hypothetical protein